MKPSGAPPWSGDEDRPPGLVDDDVLPSWHPLRAVPTHERPDVIDWRKDLPSEEQTAQTVEVNGEERSLLPGVVPAKRSGWRHPLKNRGAGAWENVQSGLRSWAGEFPRLLTHGGVNRTGRQYLKQVFDFLRAYKTDPLLREKVPQMDTVTDVDRVGTWFMERQCYKELKSHQDGKNLRSGLLALAPELKGELPWSTRASKVWERQVGNAEREPLCREFMGLMIEGIARRNRRMGWSAFSQWDSGLREQDIEALTTTDISISTKNPKQPVVSLELGVLERGESTKSGTSQGVVVLSPHLGQFFIVCKRVLKPGAKVFPFLMQ